jgi:hypothetical protein
LKKPWGSEECVPLKEEDLRREELKTYFGKTLED